MDKTGNQTSHLAFTSGTELETALRHAKYGRPLALGAVVQDAVDKGDLIPVQQFKSATKSIYSRSWVPSPWQVVNWGLRQVGIGGASNTDKLSVGDFVVVANVEHAAQALLACLSNESTSLTSRLYTRSLFEEEFAGCVPDSTALSSTDMSLLLTYLDRDKPVLTFDNNTVKISTPETPSEPITDTDARIASMRSLLKTLESKVAALTTQISDLDRAARVCVAEKRLEQAKRHLRSKKACSEVLTQRSAALEKVEEAFASIETAADNVAIVFAMRDSEAVLRDLNAEVGGAEGAERIAEDLRKQMDITEDVRMAVQEANPAGIVDEQDVDEEFEAMEREAREAREKREAKGREKRGREEAERTAERLKELESKPLDEIKGDGTSAQKNEAEKAAEDQVMAE